MRCSSILASAIAMLLFAMAVSVASANGGTVQISNAPAGPYQLSAFTNPSPVRVGTVDVSVLVQPTGSTDVVPDAIVMVTAAAVGHEGAMETFVASHELATNKLYYAANVALPSEGRWRIEVIVLGAAGEGTAAFEVDATRETLLDRPVVLLGFVAVPVVALLAWILVRGRRAEAR